MRTIMAEPLTVDGFRAFGEVLEAPVEPGRVYIEDALRNDRAEAKPSLSFVKTGPATTLPLEARVMERHPFSSQSFIPLAPCRWLVIVAPGASGQDRPDEAKARAFLAGPGQGITYGADVWHHPLSALADGALFAILMWRDRSAGDDELVNLRSPLLIAGA